MSHFISGKRGIGRTLVTAMMIAVLLIKPEGLFGKYQRTL